MKLLGVIDHLGSGGAQRQMSVLARALAARGHEVHLFLYYPEHDFFAAGLREAGVVIHGVRKRGRFSVDVLRALRSRCANGGYDVVLSFLDTPNIYAELARLLSGLRVPLVVSERSSHLADTATFQPWLKRRLYMLATHVVTNNVAQRDWLRGHRWLRHKVTSIYNGLDLSLYAPAELPVRRELRLIGIGRVMTPKNIEALIEALARIERRGAELPYVSWVGRDEATASGRRYRELLDGMLAARPAVAARWSWLGERRDVPALLREHDALIHPSHFEGLPNVVCEAFATGRPALLSDVCDHPILAGDGARGLVFDQRDPERIADAILAFRDLDPARRAEMGRNARRYAERELSIESVARAYEALLSSLARRDGSRVAAS